VQFQVYAVPQHNAVHPVHSIKNKGALLNQDHAVRLKMSTSLQCPLCQQADSALHILSGCRHTIISDITERHNVACRLQDKLSWKPSANNRIHILNMCNRLDNRWWRIHLHIPKLWHKPMIWAMIWVVSWTYEGLREAAGKKYYEA